MSPEFYQLSSIVLQSCWYHFLRNIVLFKFFPRDCDTWKSEGTTLEVYDVWWDISHFNYSSFCKVWFATCGLEMAWREMKSFRLAKFGRLSWIAELKLVNCLQYFIAVILSPTGRKSNLLRSHQTHSNYFIECKPAIGTGSVHSHACFQFHLGRRLSYMIHLSSAVNILSKTWDKAE